ncbi:hypothetical protein CONLIGDRAFT_687641 [Coniochaeta ligniaria NRRL 30616]|uniref:Uncharacterized protein n=1 Tax=Coniochaeta ligniaria NRRL 30616 TaxID=1408157 RepID=A0A1J7J4B9_9PEZI|nr:hypothetical protein CONLIGDRAFT_687641 [Coniochaeta ligniaria NRRL 30616]
MFCDVPGWQQEEVPVLTSKERKELRNMNIYSHFDFHVVYGPFLRLFNQFIHGLGIAIVPQIWQQPEHQLNRSYSFKDSLISPSAHIYHTNRTPQGASLRPLRLGNQPSPPTNPSTAISTWQQRYDYRLLEAAWYR